MVPAHRVHTVTQIELVSDRKLVTKNTSSCLGSLPFLVTCFVVIALFPCDNLPLYFSTLNM